MYFITLCVQDRHQLFGSIVNGEMKLNIFGEIVLEEWLKTPEIRENTALGECIVMPDHFHAILEIKYKIDTVNTSIEEFKSPSHTVGAVVRGYKGATTKRIKEYIRQARDKDKGESQLAPGFPPGIAHINLSKSIWQRDYYERIIRSEQAHRRISQYIINNPAKWQANKSHKK